MMNTPGGLESRENVLLKTEFAGHPFSSYVRCPEHSLLLHRKPAEYEKGESVIA